MCMRIRIYYMYILYVYFNWIQFDPPESPSTWGTAKQGSLKRQLKALLKPKMSTPIWMSPLTHTSPTQRCCVSTQSGNDENGAEMCRRYCQSNGPRRLETKGLLHRSWVDQRLCFCVLRRPGKQWKTHSPIFLALQGKIRIVFRLLCF